MREFALCLYLQILDMHLCVSFILDVRVCVVDVRFVIARVCT